MINSGSNILYISVDDIVFNNNKIFDEQVLNELSETMFKNGMLEPLKVVPENDKYKMIDEEKYKVALNQGFRIIPVIIDDTIYIDDNSNIENNIVSNDTDTYTTEKSEKEYTKEYHELPISPFMIDSNDTINKYIVNEYNKNETVSLADNFFGVINKQIINDSVLDDYNDYSVPPTINQSITEPNNIYHATEQNNNFASTINKDIININEDNLIPVEENFEIENLDMQNETNMKNSVEFEDLDFPNDINNKKDIVIEDLDFSNDINNKKDIIIEDLSIQNDNDFKVEELDFNNDTKNSDIFIELDEFKHKNRYKDDIINYLKTIPSSEITYKEIDLLDKYRITIDIEK